MAILGIVISVVLFLAGIFFHLWRDRTARVIYWNALPPQLMVSDADADDLEIKIGKSNIQTLTKYTFELENRGRQDIEWTEASYFHWSGPGQIWAAKVAGNEEKEGWMVNVFYKRKPRVDLKNAVRQSDLDESMLAVCWGALRRGSTHRVEVYCESDPQRIGSLDAAFPNTRVQERPDFVTVGKDTRKGVRQRVWVAVFAGFIISVQVASFFEVLLKPAVLVSILAGYGYTSLLMAGIYRIYPVGRRKK